MQREIKQLAGIMDTDSSNEVMNSVFHKYARNVKFRGDGKNTRAESILGTTQLINPYLPTTGANECIGEFYDEKKLRIFFFNWNSLGSHGIYIFYTQTSTFAQIIQNGTGTNGDILGFTLQRYITSINIIYGGQSDGDLLLFLDSLKRPTKLNIDRYIAGSSYSLIKRSFINVIKAPPQTPALVTYENDFLVTVNNLRNSLFQFKYRYWYDDNDKSVWSTGSIVPLPDTPFRYQTDTNTAINARISIYIRTGEPNVKKIEIACRQSTSGITSDYFLINTLDKAQLSIPDNNVYRVLFYNDGVYSFIDKTEGDLLFDYVPREANAQEVLNGNVPIYGGIKEGYNKVIPILSSQSLTSLLPYNIYNGILFFAFQDSDTQITIYLTGTGINDGIGNVAELSEPPAVFYVHIMTDLFVDKSFTFNNTFNDGTLTTLLPNITAQAVAQGFTLASAGTNSITLTYPSKVRLNSSGVLRSSSTTFATNESTSFCYAPESNQSFAIQYYDENGITNGGFTDIPYQIKTQPIGPNWETPLIELFISHRPPIWAKEYQIVRTGDLTYLKRLHWVTKNAQNGFVATSSKQYAYVDVSNIAEYNIELSASDGVVTYSFAKGDRIKFISRRPTGSPAVQLTGLDFEIVGTVTTVKINGVDTLGNWVQIVYPTSFISVDFKFDGTPNFLNYEILLYSLKPHVNDNSNLFNEFGKKFYIGNYGTTSAYHVGQEQTQSVDLSVPAQINTVEGDYFFRQRSIPVGISYQFPSAGYTDGLANGTMVSIQVPSSPITTPSYNFGSQLENIAGPLITDPPTTASTNWIFQNTSSGVLRVRITATLTVSNNFLSNNFQCYAKMINNPVGVDPVILYDLVPLQHGLVVGSHTYNIDTVITTYAGSKVWILFYKTDSAFQISATNWTFEALSNVTINIIEKSYSDVYNIQTNSNSRPTIVDPNAKEVYFPTLLRWGLAYEADTNINQSNRFFPLNFDEIDRARGDIQRFMIEARILYAYQNRAVGTLGIYAKFLQDSGNTNILTTTDNIITPNNVSYLLGEFGLGDRPEGLCKGKNVHYFFDPIRGYWVRRAGDGLIPLNEIYKGQFAIRDRITPYAKDWITPNGGIAKIVPFYDFFEEQCVAIFQGGTNGANTLQNSALGFNEKRNGFVCDYDLYVDWITCAEDITYSWKAGQMYIHNNNTAYNNFHGTQYYPSITLNFNDKVAFKKTFEALSYQSNQIWAADTNGDVNTSQTNPQTGFQQISNLKIVDFEIMENIRYAAFQRDANSLANPKDGVAFGDVLKGVWIEVKLTYKGSNFAYLYLPEVLWNNSPKN